MNCNDISAAIEAYFDGAMNVPLRRKIEAHLSVCFSCESNLKQLQAMRSLLERDAVPEPSPSLDAQVMQAFRDRRAGPQGAIGGWLSLITGSIRIPKPLVATSIAVLALTSIISFEFGRRTADRIVIPSSPASTTAKTIQLIPHLNQVRVDARDKGQSHAAPTGPKSIRAGTLSRRLGRKSVAHIESLTLVSQSGTNYSTRTSLNGFEPLGDANVRIVRTLEQK